MLPGKLKTRALLQPVGSGRHNLLSHRAAHVNAAKRFWKAMGMCRSSTVKSFALPAGGKGVRFAR